MTFGSLRRSGSAAVKADDERPRMCRVIEDESVLLPYAGRFVEIPSLGARVAASEHPAQPLLSLAADHDCPRGAQNCGSMPNSWIVWTSVGRLKHSALIITLPR
jgi:hypothetical protein